MFTIELYKREDGTVPVREFLSGLTLKDREKIAKSIDLLARMGNDLRMPYSRYIGKSIYELRTAVGKNAYRTFYFFQKGKIIILSNCYAKKTPKMDKREFERSVRYKEDYERRIQ